MKTITLYRPTGPNELAWVKKSDYRAWPPRLTGQPIFYPVLNEEYAIQIARDWNVKESGSGYVTRFKVDAAYLSQFDIHVVGGSHCQEYWIPAARVDEFNQHIVGEIEVIHQF